MQKKVFKLFKSGTQKGFTLIELLVVLGILGILAAALLAAINPVEQLNKAQDTSLKNATSQIVSAMVQYYATNNVLPWDPTAPSSCNGSVAPSATNISSSWSCLTNLINGGELKASFTNASNLNKIYITSPNPIPGSSQESVVACFAPQSHASQLGANDKFNSDGTIQAGCPKAGGTCYWCAE